MFGCRLLSRWPFGWLAVSPVLLLVVAGCKEPPPPAKVIRPVRAVRLNDVAAFHSGYLPGRAKATQEVDLAFRVPGPLIDFPVDVGQRVKAGEVVARIDPSQFDYELKQAQANRASAVAELKAMQTGARLEEIAQLEAAVDKAKAKLRTANNELERARPLVSSSAITESDFDRYQEQFDLSAAEVKQVEKELEIGRQGARAEDIAAKQAEVESLEAAISLAEDQQSYTQLKAPFAGTVVAKYVDNFEDVQAKQAVVRIVDASRIEIVINIPEGSISLVPLVSDITCTFDSLPDQPLPAKVKEVGTEASRSTRTYPVTLVMEQPEGVEILPGMTGRVRGKVKAQTADGQAAIEVPETAVFEKEGKNCVWLLESADGKSGTAALQEVQVDELSTRGLRITSGLKSEDLVVTAGVYEIEPGQQVRILLTPYEATAP